MLRFKYPLILLLFYTSLQAQNVGIGNPSPQEKLDVNGNINLTGNLMIHGNAGQNGQVLTMNGGSMVWMDKSRFKNVALYTNSGTFTVPTNVSEIMIEMWGAGGGGHNPGGGGGSGAYFLGAIPVSPTNEITITIGTGGSGGGASTNATSGTTTQVTAPGFTFSSFGGGLADSLQSATLHRNIGGGGGLVGVSPSTFRNFIQYPGNPGQPTFDSYLAITPTVFRVLTHYGIGGVPPFSGNTPDTPATKYTDENGIMHWSYFNPSAPKFGNGGSVAPTSTVGHPGGNGRVILYY